MGKKLNSSKSAKEKKRLFRQLSTWEKTVAIVILAALLVGVWLPNRIIVSTSPSLSYRIFFLTPVSKQKITNGDYLVFRNRNTEMTFIRKGLNKKNDRLIKKVGCSPGEILSEDANQQWYCGQNYIGKALLTDSKGRELPQFNFSGPVPENNFFMVGDNPRSFDSKYFGFIHADDFFYKALPLW